MKASVAGRVRNTSLPRNQPLLPVFEAIMNAFQSIEEAGHDTRHSINVNVEREGDLENDKAGPVRSFTVVDTGVGFTDENYDSFNIVDSPYKAFRGGKGLGRFLWLKAFDRVEIDSSYRNGLADGLQRRRFAFRNSDDEQPSLIEAAPDDVRQTAVKLIGYKEPYRTECPRALDVLAQRFISHFLPLFLDPKGPSLYLSDASQRIDLNKYFRENFEALATHREVTIGTRKFTISGFRLHGVSTHHELAYGAHFREVIKEPLAKFLPNLKNRLVDAVQGQFVYLAFVQGDYLDERVNSERTDFSFPREKPAATQRTDGQIVVAKKDDLFASDISLEEIRAAALGAITIELQPYLDEINAAKEEALNAYIAEDAPQYRILMKYKNEFIDKISPEASKPELEMALHRQLYDRQVRIKQEGTRILAEVESAENQEDYYARFRKFVEDANEIGKTALAQYVVHRRVILELLQKALSKSPETGDYSLEKTVHELVFPMRTTSEDVPFEQQNLWIIDERLTFHSFLSSDKTLSTISPIEVESDSRPDLLIFNRPLAFSDESVPLQSIVVVEFKKPDRNSYDEDPVTQVYRMVREIREGKSKDKSGRLIRPANDSIPAYCYIVCDLTPPVERRIQNMGARRTPDNLGYYGFNEALNAYYEVISYTKLLDDAKKRNRILFEKLNLPPPG